MNTTENIYNASIWILITCEDEREQLLPIIARIHRERPTTPIVELHSGKELMRAIRSLGKEEKPDRLICVAAHLNFLHRFLLKKRAIDVRYFQGDTRFDSAEATVQAAREDEIAASFIGSTRRVIVAGETDLQDEQMLTRYIDEHEDTKLILIPHEPDTAHLQEIFQLTHGHQIRYTEATPINVQTNRVLVVEPTELRAGFYRYATAAYVGGGLGRGLGNAIEPAAWGKPVLFAPKYTNRPEGQILINCGGAVSIRNYDELCGAMEEALSAHDEIGAKSRHFVVENLTNETNKIYQQLTA